MCLRTDQGMDDIVPGALQRLREADIVGLAGLAGASLGQEYARNGFVSTMKRQGALLSAVVEVPETSLDPTLEPLRVEELERTDAFPGTLPAPVVRFDVEIEVVSRTSCQVVCN